MDAYWGYNQDSSTNNMDIASASPPTGNTTTNTAYGQYWGNYRTYTDYPYDYNSYFGSVYGNVNDFLQRILDVLTLTAIVATVATLLVVIINRRFHMQHHIFPANIIISGLVTACSVGLRIIIHLHYQECRFFCELMIYTPCFSALVSNISILSVAVYQLINIRIDPFGSRGIVTTIRCVAVAILTWSTVGALGIIAILFSPTDTFLFILTVISISSTVFTGCSYLLIYRSVAGTASASVESKQRKEENSRILQTIAMVYGTNLFLAILPSTYWVMLVVGRVWGPLIYLATLSNVLSSVANSIVYWWRMKEFKELMPSFRRNRRVQPIINKSFNTEQIVIQNIK